MPFEKGKAANPKGRPKGSKNRRSNFVREQMNNIRMRALRPGTTPLEVMMLRLMGKPVSDKQYEAAKDLAKFFHPQLAPAPAAQADTVTKIVVEGGLPDIEVAEQEELEEEIIVVRHTRKA